MATPELPPTNPSAASAEPFEITTSFGTIDSNEIWRIEEAGELVDQLRRLFRPNMGKGQLESALETMGSRVVGAMIGEYRLGHVHGQRSVQDETERPTS